MTYAPTSACPISLVVIGRGNEVELDKWAGAALQRFNEMLKGEEVAGEESLAAPSWPGWDARWA